MRFVCKKCDYHFESDDRKEKYPYCGEKTSLTEIAGAEELVGDSYE